ncbi:hypothetical protein MBSD_n1787 [Mizugakiibacter sediminis]|uniref:DUF3108 domain-containing protein n=1 Tax=Mizugakiibacter sediminis TaxID=1475481 RepID=A0A0K8QNL8_9GAMM|nr:DUF3108 domain-containing protein [Mizugakiibacter sediminis]GAP66479.1 hypothetical protein MBSD_n1787 [Mizugakiibacter sediminis]
MKPPSFRLALHALLLALAGAAATAAAAPLPAFTARYQVERDGAAIGEATMSLRSDGDGRWIYRTETRGTDGLAALLGLSALEISTLQWGPDGRPQSLDYRYEQQGGFKQRSRTAHFDWQAGRIAVREGKGRWDYAAAPGAVDRHAATLAVAAALRAGAKQIAVPVAVKDRIEVQHFAVTGSEPVQVPAGRFTAERVERRDDGKTVHSWYVPQRFPVPVEIAGDDGITLKLVSYAAP